MIITRKIKKHLVLLTLLIILSLMAFFSVAGVYASQSRVIDNAGLLTSDQRSALETQVNKAISVMNMDLVVLTIDDAEGKTSAAYADDYYDYNGYGTGSNKSGALILIDMDNRQIYISTTGEMINRLSDSDIESVIDSGYSRLKSGDYYGCLTKCVKSLEDKGRGNYISVMKQQDKVIDRLSTLEGIWQEYQVYNRDEMNYADDKVTLHFEDDDKEQGDNTIE